MISRSIVSLVRLAAHLSILPLVCAGFGTDALAAEPNQGPEVRPSVPDVRPIPFASPQVNLAVADPGRPPWERTRDKYSNPALVLTYAGLAQGMSVAELMPDSGYYTRLLSRGVGNQGRVYTVVPFTDVAGNANRAGPPMQDPGQNKPLTRVELAYAIENVPLYKRNVTVLWQSVTQYGGQFALPEQVDLVLTDGDYHAFHGKEFEGVDMIAVDRAILRALKPLGTFIVIDHAANKGSGFSAADTLRRSDPDAVKAEIVSAGFVFDGEIKVASLPSDDHAKPVDPMHPYPVDDFVFRFKKPLLGLADARPGPTAMNGFFGNTTSLNAGARGKVTNERERRHFYHPDGTYEEFGPPDTGNNPWQMGLWYWDAAGHNCMLHEYPYDSRGLVVCHDLPPYKKVGDKWTRGNDGQVNRHPNPEELLPGYARFE